MNLGKELIRNRLITEEGLRLALERQVIFGGKIGTNIIELGILKEGEFVKFLGDHFGMPYVESSELENISEEAVSALGRRAAKKHKAVPFRKDGGLLHVAMLDKGNALVLDELRAESGCEVKFHVASEHGLLLALQKHYGFKNSKFYGMPEDGSPESDSDARMEAVKRSFASVGSREKVAGLVLNEAMKAAKRAALFLVKDKAIIGWKAKGIDVDGFRLTPASSSMFREVLMRRAYYRGPITETPGNKEIIRVLGGTPQDSLLSPINLREKVVALLYADNGNSGVLDANLAYLNTLCLLTSLSFELLIVKKKIREM